MNKYILLSLVLLFCIDSGYSQNKKQKKDDFFDETVDELLPNLVLNTFYNFIHNPAMAGFEKRQNLQFRLDEPILSNDAISRLIRGQDIHQYPALDFIAAYDISLFKKRRFAIGGYYQLDQGGIYRNSKYNLSSSFKYVKWNTHFRIGVSATIHQNQLDFKRMFWFDQIDKRLGFINPTGEAIPDIFQPRPYLSYSGGFFVQRYDFYSGITIRDFNEPEFPYYSDAQSYLLKSIEYFATYKLKWKEAFTFYPMFRYRFHQYHYFQAGINMALYDEIMVGFDYEFNDINVMYYNINLGIDLYQSILLTTTLSYAAEKGLRQDENLVRLQAGLLFQFGSTKKNMAKWSDM